MYHVKSSYMALTWIKLSCDNLKILLMHEIKKRIFPAGTHGFSESPHTHQIEFFMSLFLLTACSLPANCLLAAWPNWNAHKHPAVHTFFWQSTHNGPLHVSSAHLRRRSVILQTGREGSSMSPPSLCGGWRAPHCVICRH